MSGKRKIKIARTENEIFGLCCPIIAIHQLYVSELCDKLTNNFGDGLFISKWLFKKAGLKNGEKITLTREKCRERRVDCFRNRTTTPVFFWDKSHVRAIGPTAKFLGRTGLSCLIAYGRAKSVNNITALDLNFPFGNSKNDRDDLQIRIDVNQNTVDKVKENVYKALDKLEREVLVAQFIRLTVERGDPYCNPTLAQIPETLIKRAGLPVKNIEAFFANNSKSLPALKSYAVPSKDKQVAMSGALFGAFPVGTEFVINVFGRTRRKKS